MVAMPQVSSKKVDAVASRLRKQVLDGHWSHDEKLPVESALAESFGCSISTISKAMGLLVHEGLIERKARAGTRVISGANAPQKKAAGLESYAFIYPAERHEGIWRAARGFQDAAHECGRRVMMLSTGMDFHREAEFMTRLSEFDVQGAVVYPHWVSSEAQACFVKTVAASKFPIVLTAHNPLGLDCPVVTLDGFHAGHTVTKHLIDQGARKIGYLSDRARSVSMRERHLGYRRAMEEAGLPVQPEWVRMNPATNVNFADPLAEPEAMAADYLREAGEIDGVVCSTDFLGVALIKVAREQNRRIPGDLKVVGMDDYDFSATGEVPLTSYRIPYEQIGRGAFQQLASVIEGNASAAAESLVRGELIVRAST